MFSQAGVNRRHTVLAYGIIGREGYAGHRAARLVRFECGDLAWYAGTFFVWGEFIYLCSLRKLNQIGWRQAGARCRLSDRVELQG